MQIPVEFLTNDELVNELIKRESFAGMVLVMDGDAREFDNMDAVDFKLYGRGFDPPETVDVLEMIIDKLNDDELPL